MKRSKAESLSAFAAVLAGYYSTLSDEELAAANARIAARHQAVAA